MAKVRIKVRPSGLINGREWPEVGEVIDLPAVVAESMGEFVEPVEERRPAPVKGVEKRGGKGGRRGMGNTG